MEAKEFFRDTTRATGNKRAEFFLSQQEGGEKLSVIINYTIITFILVTTSARARARETFHASSIKRFLESMLLSRGWRDI